MTHPLTDDLAENIALDATWSSDIGELVFRHDDMRAAYDKGGEDMLEQVIEWIEENGHEYVDYHYELGCQSNFSQMITDFKQAMRPQVDS